MSQIKTKVKTRPGFFKEEEDTKGIKEESSTAKCYDNSDLSLFNNKVALATEGLQPYFERMLREKVSKQNALTISEYTNR